MDKKTTPTHIVIDKDYIQALPTMKEPTYAGMPASKCPCIPLLDISYYEKAIKDFNDHLASLPKILRADEGKWEIGQQLTEHVDFQKHWYNHGGFDKPDHYDWAAIPLEAQKTDQFDFMGRGLGGIRVLENAMLPDDTMMVSSNLFRKLKSINHGH
jgi:hypothetical protein